MAGKIVTTTRKINSVQGRVRDLFPFLVKTGQTYNGNSSSVPANIRPFVSYTDGIGRLFTVYPAVNGDFFPTQTTTSFRSVGSPLGPSRDELASILASPIRAIDYMPYDNGHEFSTVKEGIVTSHTSIERSFNGGTGFRGPLHLETSSNTSAVNGLPALPAFDPNYYGRLLISMAAPTVPQVNLLTTGAELLREGFTSPGKDLLDVIKGRTTMLRGIGSEYLNAQFGWLPLMSDLQSLLRVVVKHAELIKAYRRDSGRVVRRRRGFPIKDVLVSHSSSGSTGLYVAGGSQIYSGAYGGIWKNVPSSGSVPATITKQTSERIWFSGAFTYYLAPDGDLADKFEYYEQLASYLLGLRMTPEVLWELMPWSWLVDYFFDVGRAIKLTSMFQNDGLVMRYGYLMRHVTQKVTVTAKFPPLKDGTSLDIVTTRFRETKSRYKATPYGFGLNPNSLTDRQWSILGALGLTKSPKTLP